MIRLSGYVLICLLVNALTAPLASAITQQEMNDFAASATIKQKVISNFGANSTATIKFILENKSSVPLVPGAGNWEIWFHYARKYEPQIYDGMSLEHVNGDLHVIRPTFGFPGLAPGQKMELFYSHPWDSASTSLFMPRMFITAKNLKPAVFANTDVNDEKAFVLPMMREDQYKRYPHDVISRNTDGVNIWRYERNAEVTASGLTPENAMRRIVPTPRSVKYEDGTVTFGRNIPVTFPASLEKQAEMLRKGLAKVFGEAITLRKVDTLPRNEPGIRLERSGKNEAEGYTLVISNEGVAIAGNDEAGIFYGIMSLLNLLPAKAGSLQLPQMQVEDAPRYAWRGMMVDVARNFRTKEEILKTLDAMAVYKLNRLHLHLTDDEGWRLEIKGLPELTEVAGKRCFDLDEEDCLLTQLGAGPYGDNTGSGYYTTEDYIEIVRYANERFITVLPEYDGPGHARAAIKAMEARYKKYAAQGNLEEANKYRLADPDDKSEYNSAQNYNDNAINVCRPSAYRFMAKVIDEVKYMHEMAGQPLKIFHAGGDEVAGGAWEGSPICKQLIDTPNNGVDSVKDLKKYYLKNVAHIAWTRNLDIANWADGMMYDNMTPFERSEFPVENMYAHAWNNVWEWGAADKAYFMANAGYKVVIDHATHTYFDHPYEPTPTERGYYWAPRYTDTRKTFGYMPDNFYASADYTRPGEPIEDLEALMGRPFEKLHKPENIMGMQGHLWGETVRTGEQYSKLVFPRMVALAERVWHRSDWEGDAPDLDGKKAEWADFASVLAVKELPRLNAMGLKPRVPAPGAVVKGSKLHANVAFPNLTIQYSKDKKTWRTYQDPIEFTGLTYMRSVTGNGIASKVIAIKK
ncbi:family 20 glycosylhydrolase [Salidesulfovibrio onnuriiensis]|uniref:family 20 glycosylhydrolase n=1 Tax=Salidesulfovibrio onnuriiensis TaxID=2583823 RepID=UPI00164FD109|nr:family 20 glycosylhydrolase [Salidesulfovibrio onnuriiensis]